VVSGADVRGREVRARILSDFQRAAPDYVSRNRASWDGLAREYEDPGRRNWAQEEPTWGIWGVPESQVQMLPADVAGLDSIELGCGTSYVSAWLARRGARPDGIDNSEAQLTTARQLQREFGLEFPLLHGNAEQVPFPDASFDLAISEYGASIWCDPYRWIPEAARLLRPGGRLVFLMNGTLLMLCVPDEGTRARRIASSGRISVCTASSGRTATRSSSTSRTAR